MDKNPLRDFMEKGFFKIYKPGYDVSSILGMTVSGYPILDLMDHCKDYPVVQTFTHLETSRKEKDKVFVKTQQKDSVRNKLSLDKQRYYIHTPISINLCNDINMTMTLRDIELLRKDLVNGRIIGAPCIMHIGNSKRGGTLNNLVKNLNTQLSKYLDPLNSAIMDYSIRPRPVIDSMKTKDLRRPTLLLENSAGQGTQLGSQWDEWVYLDKHLKNLSIGWCIDTQHIFASKASPLSTRLQMEHFFEDCRQKLGRYPDLIHLNDSKSLYGSRVDRHENIGTGKIWNDHKAGLYELLKNCQSLGIDMVLETPHQEVDMKRLLDKTI